jgi:hypothetical protein
MKHRKECAYIAAACFFIAGFVLGYGFRAERAGGTPLASPEMMPTANAVQVEKWEIGFIRP